jgi:hypothetical protein
LTTEILLIEKIEFDSRTVSFAARCHSGILRIGDSLPVAVDPSGARYPVDVRCVEIRLTKTIMVDELTDNYGGLVVFEGPDISVLSVDWTLYSE